MCFRFRETLSQKIKVGGINEHIASVCMHIYTNKHTHIIIIIEKHYHSLLASDPLGAAQVVIHTITEDTA